MRHSIALSPITWLLTLLAVFPFASIAERLIISSSLNPCQSDSLFSATLFNVAFTPDNKTVTVDIEGVSSISGNVTLKLDLIVYGYNALQETIDPCTDADGQLMGLCPMNTGTPNFPFNLPLSDDVVSKIPGIAYTIPDLDAKARVLILSKNDNKQLACVEAPLSNGQSVYQKAVGWVTAVIAGLGLIASAITNGLGHSNTAAHVAANAMSLFGYFQGQAFIGMTAVTLPPIVQSWTQNFQWSMGIIRVGFLQDMATWYQRSTGGSPSTILSNLANASVQVQKRSLDAAAGMVRRARSLVPRTNAGATNAQTSTNVVVQGIKRVGFRARIEPTNIFLTGYAFFIIFVLLVIICVVAFKYITEALVKSNKMKSDKFQEFRNGWLTVLKGIMFRIILIGFPQMVVLCFWELTVRDSAAEVVLAIFTLVTMLAILGWAAFKVIRIAQRSIQMHKNPAYILYSDPVSLNKWGFLYVQFKASAYYFIVPILGYLLIKGMFVALSQGSGAVQAVAFILIEAGLLVGICILRPYMDKKTNSFNIAIAAIQFLSSIFLLIFSDVFNQPGIVTGVVGVIFFVVNVIFAFVLLIMVLVSSCYALFSKNPDTRYQPMRDDRGSFIKSQTQLNTELDALGATARGEGKGSYGKPRTGIDDDDDSYSSSSAGMRQKEANSDVYSTPTAQPNSYFEPARTNTSSPAPPYNGGYGQQQQYSRPGSTRSDRNRTQNNASPWQRGAGYDH